MSIKLIGKTNYFLGNTLWEIVSNLKNFGVGRVIVRTQFERYPEKSYMRILKVEAMDEPPKQEIPYYQRQRRVKVWVEKVFRGRKFDLPAKLDSATYKNDYRLLSKKEEADYCQSVPHRIKLLSPTMDLPPLLKEMVKKETGVAEPKMKVRYTPAPYKLTRVAEEGEVPDITLSINIGKPHPKGAKLYEGVQL